MTNEEINKRVALAMGWRWQEGEPTDDGGGGWIDAMWRTRDDKPVYSSGMFCTDPAAADLVRIEIERRGWWWRSVYADMNGSRAPLPNYACAIGGKFLEGTEHEYDGIYRRAGSPYHALCLAFLAAHEATDTDRAGDDPEGAL
jgi:hypothetical protein